MQRDIDKYTQDYLANSYDFENIMVSFRRKKVLNFLGYYKAKNILEIGCGSDSIANYYKKFESFCIVEPSKIFAEKAQKDLSRFENIRVINDFVESKLVELRTQRFDFIILSSLLHEVVNPEAFLKDIFSLCNPNTILHINVPNAYSFHLLWAYQSGLISALGDLTHTAKNLQQHTTFSLTSLIDFVNQANGGGGVTIMDKGSYLIKPFNHRKMQECMQNGVIDENLLLGLDKMIDYLPDFGAEIFVNCKVCV
ncbi:methyltransferase domain-containing protein [Helicobacter trogontum]|uniref:Methyltransferase domain-containing protein n=2 Tax=Helicobacter trogontum TaxID=50960 RepID=A0A4U8SBE2_9HELI|nr:methyltransferase domain-containing protein [Helicobacter trogontum]TLD83380.1 methyltransferase domain-containing protein [Helicobacter trogontum]